MLPDPEPVLLAARYRTFPRTGYFAIGFAALFAAAAIKFLVTRFFLPLPYLGLGIAAALGWVAFVHHRRGDIRLTASHLHARGGGDDHRIERQDIAWIELSGSRRGNDLGVTVVTRDGKRILLPRIVPPAAIQTLLGTSPSRP